MKDERYMQFTCEHAEDCPDDDRPGFGPIYTSEIAALSDLDCGGEACQIVRREVVHYVGPWVAD